MSLEPNPLSQRGITTTFLEERSRYFESFGRLGWGPGLLPPRGAPSFDLVEDPTEVLQLRRLRALGVRGFPILVGDEGHARPAPVRDTGDLEVGRHRVYACLAWQKQPDGELFEELRMDGGPPIRGQKYVRQQVVLETDDSRLQHRDWLQIAEIERVREMGTVRTRLDTSFHPMLLDMAAYTRSNPLTGLATRILAWLDSREKDLQSRVLRTELVALRNAAEEGSPQLAFLQAQRCIALLRGVEGLPLVLSADLEGYRYSNEALCKFLAHLAWNLVAGTSEELYPVTLEADSVRYLRLPGEFVEDGDYWVWRGPSPDFVAGGLAIYLPHADRSSVPHVQYARHRNAPMRVSTAGESISKPGVVLVLDQVGQPVSEVYLAAESFDKAQRLRMNLKEGHAVYYR